LFASAPKTGFRIASRDKIIDLKGNRSAKIKIGIERADDYEPQIGIDPPRGLNEHHPVNLGHVDVNQAYVKPMVGQLLKRLFGI